MGFCPQAMLIKRECLQKIGPPKQECIGVISFIHRLWGKGFYIASVSKAKIVGGVSKTSFLTPFFFDPFQAREDFSWQHLHFPRSFDWRKTLHILGFFTVGILFGSKKRRGPLRTKAFSWDGRLYFLNLRLSLCVREREIVAINPMGCNLYFINSYWANTLKDVIYHNFIAPISRGPLRYLTENKILIEVAL